MHVSPPRAAKSCGRNKVLLYDRYKVTPQDTRLKPPTYATQTAALSYNQPLPFLTESLPCLFYCALRFTYFAQFSTGPVHRPLRSPVRSARGSASFPGAVAKVYRPRPRNAIVGKGTFIRTRAFLTHKSYLAGDPSSWTPHLYTTRQLLTCPSSPGLVGNGRKNHHIGVRLQNGEPIRFNRQPESLGTTTAQRHTGTGL